MPDETQTSGSRRSSGSGEKQTQAQVKEAREEARYTAEQLRAEGRARFNVSPHAVAGALSAGSKQSYTLDEAKALIEKFQKNKVEG